MVSPPSCSSLSYKSLHFSCLAHFNNKMRMRKLLLALIILQPMWVAANTLCARTVCRCYDFVSADRRWEHVVDCSGRNLTKLPLDIPLRATRLLVEDTAVFCQKGVCAILAKKFFFLPNILFFDAESLCESKT